MPHRFFGHQRQDSPIATFMRPAAASFPDRFCITSRLRPLAEPALLHAIIKWICALGCEMWR
jgi:hypothetical protein